MTQFEQLTCEVAANDIAPDVAPVVTTVTTEMNGSRTGEPKTESIKDKAKPVVGAHPKNRSSKEGEM